MNGTLNKVILIGNVGGDVKVHRFDENNLIGRLSIATSESFMSKEKGQRVDQTEWHNLVVRNKLAEIFEKYVKKGDKIYVEGKLKTRKYQDQTGQEKYTTEIIVSEFTFLSNKPNNPNPATQDESADLSKDINDNPTEEKDDSEMPF